MPGRKKTAKTAAASVSYTHIVHPIPPLYDENSKILILGSFPSVKSREGMFFYHHPQNRFWKMLALLTGEACPKTIEEKKSFLHRNGFAVWDVIRECDIAGSSDASIRNAVPNDIQMILEKASIACIVTNGEKAYRMYETYLYPQAKRKAVRCPSTSPANAAYSLERLVGEWRTAIEENTSKG